MTLSNLQSESEKIIRNICTYWSEPDEISGKESAGTAGYCLSEEQFKKLFDFLAERERLAWEAGQKDMKTFMEQEVLRVVGAYLNLS